MTFQEFHMLTLAERLAYLQQHELELRREECCCEAGEHFWIERGGIPTTMPQNLPSAARIADNHCLGEYKRLIDEGLEVCAKCDTVQDRRVCRNCEGRVDD